MHEEISKEVMEQCKAQYIKVSNESHLHHHHKQSPANNHSHFRIYVCSDIFASMRLIERHRFIYKICDPFIKKGVHALAIDAYTKEEWSEKHGK